MAAMLQADGEEVALLAMLDAYPGDQWRHLDAPGEQDALRALLDIAGHDRAAWRDADPGPDRNHGASGPSRRSAGKPGPGRLAALIDIAANDIRLLRQCSHGVFHGDVLFFTAAKPRAENWLTSQSWSAYVDGRIENVDIDCTHPTMLHPSSLAVIGPILRSQWSRMAMR